MGQTTKKKSKSKQTTKQQKAEERKRKENEAKKRKELEESAKQGASDASKPAAKKTRTQNSQSKDVDSNRGVTTTRSKNVPNQTNNVVLTSRTRPTTTNRSDSVSKETANVAPPRTTRRTAAKAAEEATLSTHGSDSLAVESVAAAQEAHKETQRNTFGLPFRPRAKPI